MRCCIRGGRSLAEDRGVEVDCARLAVGLLPCAPEMTLMQVLDVHLHALADHHVDVLAEPGR